MPKRRPKLASIDPDVTQAWSPKAEWGEPSGQDQAGTTPLAALRGPDMFPALREPRDPAMPWRPDGERFADTRTWRNHRKLPAGIPDFQPAAPDTRPAPIAAEVAKGWAHLFAIACQFPAAPHDTPIPCGNAHRDDTAGSFSALRKSAHAAGWRMDAFGRMCCPDCAQDKPLFTLYPVTFWADGAADARAEGVMYRNQVTGREWPLEFTLTVFAEMRSIEEVSEARAGGGRHRAVTA